MHARLERQTGTHQPDGAPWVPCAGQSRASSVHAHRSLPTIPVRYASVDTATRGSTTLQDDTHRDRAETARIAENSQLAGRFRRWWQVMGSNHRRLSRRFYSWAHRGWSRSREIFGACGQAMGGDYPVWHLLNDPAARYRDLGSDSPRGYFVVCQNCGCARRLRWLLLGQTAPYPTGAHRHAA